MIPFSFKLKDKLHDVKLGLNIRQKLLDMFDKLRPIICYNESKLTEIEVGDGTWWNILHKLRKKERLLALNSLWTTLLSNKIKHIDRLDKIGVYKIKFADDDHVYIGKTGRSFKLGVKNN